MAVPSDERCPQGLTQVSPSRTGGHEAPNEVLQDVSLEFQSVWGLP